jgi:hypothetical protein
MTLCESWKQECFYEELDGSAVRAQRWSFIGWVTKILFPRVPPRFGRHVKPLHLQSLALTDPHWACVVGYGPVPLCLILKEGLSPSNRDINRLVMMIMTHILCYIQMIQTSLE